MFEIVRFGRHTIMNNTMTPKQHQQYIEAIKSNYAGLKRNIDELVLTIRTKVSQCNPVRLLSFSADMFLVSLFGVDSEIQVSREKVPIARMTEYIQSILVSSPNNFLDNGEKTDPSEMFYSIQGDITRLHKLIDQFYMSWGACLPDLYPKWDEASIKTVDPYPVCRTQVS